MKVKVNLSCEINVPPGYPEEDFVVDCWNLFKPEWGTADEWAMHSYDKLPDNSRFELVERAKELGETLND
jgi:hypothetical protein